MTDVAKWYGQAIKGQFSATAARRIDWVNDTVKIALVKAAYTPDQDTDDFWDDVKAHETSGTGYTAGGKELLEKELEYDAASNTVRLKAADLEWTEITADYRYAVIYKDTGEEGTSPVLGYIDTEAEQEVASGTVKIEWDATDGVFKAVVS